MMSTTANGIDELTNPFDLNTKAYEEFQEVIDILNSKIPKETIIGNAGKYLRVKDDETGTEWVSGGGGGGTSDYNELENKPKVNSVTLVGDKSLDDLGITLENISGDPMENPQLSEALDSKVTITTGSFALGSDSGGLFLVE